VFCLRGNPIREDLRLEISVHPFLRHDVESAVVTEDTAQFVAPRSTETSALQQDLCVCECVTDPGKPLPLELLALRKTRGAPAVSGSAAVDEAAVREKLADLVRDLGGEQHPHVAHGQRDVRSVTR